MIKANFTELTKDNSYLIVELYNYYVVNTTVTYSTEPVSTEEFISYYQIENPLTKAYLIYENENIAGFCILKPWNAKKHAYKRTYEISIYLNPEHCRCGIGSQAVRFLEEKAKENGIVVIMAGLSADNAASCGLCEANGFTRCGHFKNVGYKFGKFLDLYYYQKEFLENM